MEIIVHDIYETLTGQTESDRKNVLKPFGMEMSSSSWQKELRKSYLHPPPPNTHTPVMGRELNMAKILTGHFSNNLLFNRQQQLESFLCSNILGIDYY